MSLTSTDLGEFIETQGVTAQILLLDEPTPTVEMAAQVLGVQPAQIVKSVLFLADGEPVVVIASGLSRLDRKALADYLGVSRRRVKIASAEQVLAHTGYVAGSVPPFAFTHDCGNGRNRTHLSPYLRRWRRCQCLAQINSRRVAKSGGDGNGRIEGVSCK